MGLSLSSFPWSGVTSTDHWYLTSAPFYPPYILTDSTRLTRAERKKDQVCSPAQYEKVFQRIRALPPTVEHLVVQLGVLIWKRFNTQDSLSRSIQVSPSPTHAWYSWRRRSNLNLTLLLLLVGMGPWVSRDLSISLIMKLSCWMTLCVDYPAFVPARPADTVLPFDRTTIGRHGIIKFAISSRFWFLARTYSLGVIERTQLVHRATADIRSHETDTSHIYLWGRALCCCGCVKDT